MWYQTRLKSILITIPVLNFIISGSIAKFCSEIKKIIKIDPQNATENCILMICMQLFHKKHIHTVNVNIGNIYLSVNTGI